jgi:omega-amidase
MKISVLQPDIVWEDKSRNFKNLTELISPLYNETDLIILPEMFNTGFTMKPAEFAESPGEETFRWMKDIAEKGNFGVCGSYIIKENRNFFNRWMLVSADNKAFSYDKRHLFSMGGEDSQFSPGKSRVVISFRGVRILPLICYDLRFPVWSRNRNDCDLIVYAANWPAVRKNVWSTLLKARAIENQCYVAGSNRTGTDGEGIRYCGESMIINPRGELIEFADNTEECSISGELSMTELADFRKKFPVWKDADDFTLDL